MKKALRETQTLRAGAKNFSPRRRPPPVGTVRPKFNQLEMVTTFIYRPSLVKIHERNFELSWQQTHKHTETHTPTNTRCQPVTDRTDNNTLRR